MGLHRERAQKGSRLVSTRILEHIDEVLQVLFDDSHVFNLGTRNFIARVTSGIIMHRDFRNEATSGFEYEILGGKGR